MSADDVNAQITRLMIDLSDPGVPADDVLSRMRELRENHPGEFEQALAAALAPHTAAMEDLPGVAPDVELFAPPLAAPPVATGRMAPGPVTTGARVGARDLPFPVDTNASWHNHQSTQVVRPRWLGRPTSLSHLRALVDAALEQRARVRAFGTGHSYSDVAVTQDFLVDTSGLHKSLPLPPLRPGESPINYAHVEAGIKLHELNQRLDAEGRALFNLGGFTGQSIIGAASTGTHGSGLLIGNIASGIVSLVLVTEREVLRVEPLDGPTDPARYAEPGVDRLIQDDRYFNAIVVSMGCMGLVYSVIVRVRPRYLLEEVRTITRWSALKPLLESRAIFKDATTGAPHRHVEIWVNPHRTRGDHTALLTVRNEFEGTATGALTQRSFLLTLADQCQVAMNLVAALLNAFPDRIPGFLDSSFKSLAGQRLVNFSPLVLSTNDAADGFSCENAISMRADAYIHAIEATFALARAQAEMHRRYLGVLSLRFVKRSRAFLAPQYDVDNTPTCMIEVLTPAKLKGAPELFKVVSKAMCAFYRGRPHWGLEFGVLSGLEQVRSMYPRFDDWLAVYRELNPRGTFDNAFTARLGISTP